MKKKVRKLRFERLSYHDSRRIRVSRHHASMGLVLQPQKLRNAGFGDLVELVYKKGARNLPIRPARENEPAFELVRAPSNRWGNVYFRNRRTGASYLRPAQWLCMEEMRKLYEKGFRYNVWYTVEV